MPSRSPQEARTAPLANSGATPLDRVKGDLRAFIWLVWQHLGLPEPTEVQYDIAEYIQKAPRRAIVQAYRGAGKSYITSAFAVWTWLNNPQAKIMVVSASKERADAFSTFTQRLIAEVPGCQHLMPKAEQRSSKIAFDVGPAVASHSPSCKSVGITGQLTGSRSDLIIADDCEVPSNSATQGMRDKLSELVKEFDSILTPNGRVLYLGTPQCEDSLYTKLPDRGYQTRIWPALKPTTKESETYGDTLAPFVRGLEIPDGTSVDPKRFTDDDLMERRASYGKAGFSLQFQLSTQLSDADRFPLKVRDIIFLPIDKERAPMQLTWGPYEANLLNELPNVAMRGDKMYGPMAIGDVTSEFTGTVMAVDPSGRGADETGYAVVKMLNGYLWVTECGGLPGGYDDETLGTLTEIAKRNDTNAIVVESNFGDGMFVKLLEPILRKRHPCVIEEVRHSAQKERRIIDTLEPVLMRHKLVVDPAVVESDYRSAQRYDPAARLSKMLMYQLTRITADRNAIRHDDRLDALSMAVGYWVEQMSVDAQDGVTARNDEMLRRELDDFMAAAGARSRSTKPNWLGGMIDRT